MITQNVHFEINSTTVNGDISSASISSVEGRGYNVATMESDTPYPLGAEVSMVLGSRSFSGFVYRVGRTRVNAYTIECRSHTARLTTPFDPDQEVLEPASTATELCSLFASRSGIAIAYTSAQLHFGRSFKRSGTMLDALLSIARVTGSSVLCSDDNTLTISPRDVPDVSTAVDIGQSEVIDFVSDTGSLESYGISELLISSDSADLSTSQKHKLEVDSCTGRFVLYAVPAKGVDFLRGVSAWEESVHLLEYESVEDSVESIELDAEIVSVQSVKVNGFDVSGYTFEDCFLLFSTALTGKIEVSYEGNVLYGQVTATATPAGMWWLIRGEHNGEAFSEQGFLECENRGCDALPCVDDVSETACIFMPQRRNYVEGFSFWVYGGTPVVRSVGASLNIVQGSEAYVATGDFVCESFVGATAGETRIELAGVPSDVLELHTEVTDTPSWSIDGKYLLFPSDYAKVKVAYSLPCVKFTVSGTDVPRDVAIEIANACGGVTGREYWRAYDVQGFDKYDLSSYPCVLGEEVPVNVAAHLRVLPHSARGKTVTVSGGVGDRQVDNFGYVFVPANANGKYKIDASSIVHGGEVTLKVNV